jgi:hypothetical protein
LPAEQVTALDDTRIKTSDQKRELSRVDEDGRSLLRREPRGGLDNQLVGGQLDAAPLLLQLEQQREGR